MALTASLLFAAALQGSGATNAVRERDLIYLKQGGAAFTMDVFRPARPNGVAVLFVVSGGWVSSHDAIEAGRAEQFTRRGMTVFEVVHGSQPQYKIPQIQGQIVRAVRWVRANAARFDVRPDAIGIMGGSAGGHLSLMAGGLTTSGPETPNAGAKDPVDRMSGAPNAIVALFPPTDFLNYGEKDRVPIADLGMAFFLPAFGVDPRGPRETILARARQVSPAYFVTPRFPPTFLIHGDADKLVPIQQSRSFDAALASARVPHRFVEVPGAGHGGDVFWRYADDYAAWFSTHLGKK